MKPLSHLLFITDLDDTLLRADKSISRENLAAIARFRELGGRFTVATGRSIPSYLPYHDRLRPDLPVVLNNGAVLYDPYRDEILWNSVLPDSAKGYVREVMERVPAVGIEILLGKEIFVLRMNRQIRDHMEHEHLRHTMAPLSGIPGEWYKVLYAADPELLAGLTAFLAEQGHPDVSYITSSSYYCEMLPRGISKGGALRQLLETARLRDVRVYAAGDYYNDLELIRAADVGVAVANAPEEVRRAAGMVVASHEENGIAEALERLMEAER